MRLSQSRKGRKEKKINYILFVKDLTNLVIVFFSSSSCFFSAIYAFSAVKCFY
jgi:hypothetical protein